MPELIIDPRYVDIDFRAEAKKLGFIPGDLAPANQRFGEMPLGVYGDYGDEFEILPDAERTAAIERMDADNTGLEFLVRWILNQKNEGSCVGNAWTQCIQILLAKLFGEANAIQLSAISAYKQIGGSPGSGAMISDALERGEKVGVLPLDTPENRARFGGMVMPATGFYTPWPTGDWKAVARQFRIKKRLMIRSVAAMEQAGINRHPVVVGRAGHSIAYLRPTLKNGRGELYVNSWNGWGFGAGGLPHGFGFDSAGMVRSSASWAFAIVDITQPDYVLAA